MDWLETITNWNWNWDVWKQESEETEENDTGQRRSRAYWWRGMVVTLLVLFASFVIISTFIYFFKEKIVEIWNKRQAINETTGRKEKLGKIYPTFIVIHNKSETFFRVSPILTPRNFTEIAHQCGVTGNTLMSLKNKEESDFFFRYMEQRGLWFSEPCLDYFMGYRMNLKTMWMTRIPRRVFMSHSAWSPSWISRTDKEFRCVLLNYVVFENKHLRVSVEPSLCSSASKYFICELKHCKAGKSKCFKLVKSNFYVSFEQAHFACDRYHNGFLAFPEGEEKLKMLTAAIKKEHSISSKIIVDGIFNAWYEDIEGETNWIMKNVIQEGKLDEFCLVLTYEMMLMPVSCTSAHCGLCKEIPEW